MAATDFASLPGRGIKPLVSLRSHTRAALIAFVVTLFAGIPMVFIKGESFYSATAVVQVAPRYMKTLRDDGELDFPSNTQYREFLEQQTRSVARYDIVRDALAALGDKAGAWRRPQDSERRSVDLLREQLVVRSVPDTYMIEIRLQSLNKEGLAEVVNAVVSTYVERMRNERVFGSDERVRMLLAREAELAGAISDKTQKRTELALQLGIGAFTGKEENPYDRVLADMRSAHAEARNKRYEAESQQKAFETNGETDIRTRSLQEAVLIDPGLSNLKANLFKRRADLLIQLSGLQPAHPAHAEITAELKRIDTELGNQTSSLRDQVKQSVLARFNTGVDQSRRLEANIQRDMDELTRKGASFAGFYNQAMTLTHEVEQQRKELDAVRERLNHFAVEQNSFGFVRMVNPALPPESPYGPGKKKILLMVLVAALALMLVVPVGIDLLDRRIHTVNDAERVLGLTALGWMVERSNDATELFGDDLLRRMAGRLINEQQRQGTRVFAFSSVQPGGGASEMVLSLARTLDALGYSTLAVEANAFRRDARYAGSQSGLAECLRGEVVPASCVAAPAPGLPARVHAGDTGRNNHLDRLDRLKDVTNAWAGDFSFVLVDTPPLLLSADTEIVARDLAHLIVVIEANSINAGELRRAGRQLEKLEPAGLGVVVNRVRPFDGGGYLEGNILEYLSGRKLRDYFTTSHWSLVVHTRWIEMQLRFPAIAALLRGMKAMTGWCRHRTGTVPSGVDGSRNDSLRGAANGAPVALRHFAGVRKWLTGALLLATLGIAGYAVHGHPELWQGLLDETGPVNPAVPREPLPRPLSGGSAEPSGGGDSIPPRPGRHLALKLDAQLPVPGSRAQR